MNQTQAVTVQPDLPSVARLTGNFCSPYQGKTFSVRFDYQITPEAPVFARYSHDGNQGFGPNNGNGGSLPSDWLRNQNWSRSNRARLDQHSEFDRGQRFPLQLSILAESQPFPDGGGLPGLRRPGFPEVAMLAPQTSSPGTRRTPRRAATCAASTCATTSTGKRARTGCASAQIWIMSQGLVSGATAIRPAPPSFRRNTSAASACPRRCLLLSASQPAEHDHFHGRSAEASPGRRYPRHG